VKVKWRWHVADDPTPDLSFVSTDDLFDEIAGRFDACILSGVVKAGDDNDSRIYRYHGGLTACIGLSQLASHSMTRLATINTDTGPQSEPGGPFDA
jgi:hypothetical protein